MEVSVVATIAHQISASGQFEQCGDDPRSAKTISCRTASISGFDRCGSKHAEGQSDIAARVTASEAGHG
jgi:hypothetical protein